MVEQTSYVNISNFLSINSFRRNKRIFLKTIDMLASISGQHRGDKCKFLNALLCFLSRPLSCLFCQSCFAQQAQWPANFVQIQWLYQSAPDGIVNDLMENQLLILSLDFCCKHSALLSVHIILMKNFPYNIAISKHTKHCFDVFWVLFLRKSNNNIRNTNVCYCQYTCIVCRGVWLPPSPL